MRAAEVGRHACLTCAAAWWCCPAAPEHGICAGRGWAPLQGQGWGQGGCCRLFCRGRLVNRSSGGIKGMPGVGPWLLAGVTRGRTEACRSDALKNLQTVAGEAACGGACLHASRRSPLGRIGPEAAPAPRQPPLSPCHRRRRRPAPAAGARKSRRARRRRPLARAAAAAAVSASVPLLLAPRTRAERVPPVGRQVSAPGHQPLLPP